MLLTASLCSPSLYRLYGYDSLQTMTSRTSLGLEQARANLPALAAQAHAGKTSVITRHGKPYAAIVPVEVAMAHRGRGLLLSLRGSGKQLWGRSAAKTVDRLREEWN